MNAQDLPKNPQRKKYPEQETYALVAKEPETLYGTQANVSFEEEFNRAMATAITGDELRQHLYQRIDAWPWKEKLSTQKKQKNFFSYFSCFPHVIKFPTVYL